MNLIHLLKLYAYTVLHPKTFLRGIIIIVAHIIAVPVAIFVASPIRLLMEYLVNMGLPYLAVVPFLLLLAIFLFIIFILIFAWIFLPLYYLFRILRLGWKKLGLKQRVIVAIESQSNDKVFSQYLLQQALKNSGDFMNKNDEELKQAVAKLSEKEIQIGIASTKKLLIMKTPEELEAGLYPAFWATANLPLDTIKELIEEVKEEKRNELHRLHRVQQEKEAKRLKFQKEQTAKGLELYKDKWIPIKEAQRRKALEIGLENNFKELTPYEFEEFVAKLFDAMGYETKVTKKTGDYGIDVIARKGKDVIAIQVKQFAAGNNVGNRDIQRLLGAMQLKDVKANKGIVVTTSDFTVQAEHQASETPVELWNKHILHQMVKKYLMQ
ncbi:MAG: restriction endonuclease [archaeon]